MVWQHQHSFQGCTTLSSFESSKNKLKSYFKNIFSPIFQSKFYSLCEPNQQNHKTKPSLHYTSQKCVKTDLSRLQNFSCSTNDFQRCCNREIQLKQLSSLQEDREFKIFDNQSIYSFLEKPFRQHRNPSNFLTLAKNLKYIVFLIMILVGSTFSMAIQHVNSKESLKSLINLDNLHQNIHETTKLFYKIQHQNQQQIYTNKQLFFFSKPKLFTKTDLKPFNKKNFNLRRNGHENLNLMQKLSKKPQDSYKKIVKKFRATTKRLNYLKTSERLLFTTPIFRPFGIRQKREYSPENENKIYMKMFIENLKRKTFLKKTENVQSLKQRKYLNDSKNSNGFITHQLSQKHESNEAQNERINFESIKNSIKQYENKRIRKFKNENFLQNKILTKYAFKYLKDRSKNLFINYLRGDSSERHFKKYYKKSNPKITETISRNEKRFRKHTPDTKRDMGATNSSLACNSTHLSCKFHYSNSYNEWIKVRSSKIRKFLKSTNNRKLFPSTSRYNFSVANSYYAILAHSKSHHANIRYTQAVIDDSYININHSNAFDKVNKQNDDNANNITIISKTLFDRYKLASEKAALINLKYNKTRKKNLLGKLTHRKRAAKYNVTKVSNSVLTPPPPSLSSNLPSQCTSSSLFTLATSLSFFSNIFASTSNISFFIKTSRAPKSKQSKSITERLNKRSKKISSFSHVEYPEQSWNPADPDMLQGLCTPFLPLSPIHSALPSPQCLSQSHHSFNHFMSSELTDNRTSTNYHKENFREKTILKNVNPDGNYKNFSEFVSPSTKIKSTSCKGLDLKRYSPNQRHKAENLCRSSYRKFLSSNFPFCNHLTFENSLNETEKNMFEDNDNDNLLHINKNETPKGSKNNQKSEESKNKEPIKQLLQFDMNARQIYSIFEQATSYYHCQDTYSISTDCQQCKAAYKFWVCSLIIPHFSKNKRVLPCPYYEQIVENRCPYLSPHRDSQYAGEALFQSKNDVASINDILMLDEAARPSCHYPCLQNHSPNSTFIDKGKKNNEKNHSQSSGGRKVSVCLSHEEKDASDWSFDEEDEAILNYQPT